MASVGVLRRVFILRIMALLASASSILVMLLNRVDNVFGSKTHFFDVISYRYVVGVGGASFIYALIQIPFAFYNYVKEKRLIKNGFLNQFDFYGDKVIGFVLAMGVGVGFGVTYEMGRPSFQISLILGDNEKEFRDMAYISSGLLLLAFVFVALSSLLSSIRFASSTTNQPFFK